MNWILIQISLLLAIAYCEAEVAQFTYNRVFKADNARKTTNLLQCAVIASGYNPVTWLSCSTFCGASGHCDGFDYDSSQCSLCELKIDTPQHTIAGEVYLTGERASSTSGKFNHLAFYIDIYKSGTNTQCAGGGKTLFSFC